MIILEILSTTSCIFRRHLKARGKMTRNPMDWAGGVFQSVKRLKVNCLTARFWNKNMCVLFETGHKRYAL